MFFQLGAQSARLTAAATTHWCSTFMESAPHILCRQVVRQRTGSISKAGSPHFGCGIYVAVLH